MFLAIANTLSNLDIESIFGGAILVAVLTLLATGKLRFNREVKEKDVIIAIHEVTIDELRKLTKALTERDEATHVLLKELRDLAMKADLKSQIQEENGHHEG